MRILPHPTNRREFLAIAAASVLSARLAAQEPARPPLEEEIRQLADQAPLKMLFKGGTADECRQWQAAFGKKVRELLGPFEPPKKWETVVERTVELDDHRRQELLLKADGHPALPVHLLLPKEERGKRPGIVALHGHGTYGHDAVVARELTEGVENAVRSVNYDYGRQLVRRGYVVAAPCLLPFGRRLGDKKASASYDPCAVTFVRLQFLGKLLIAENLRDCLWATELLASNPAVDPNRLGCVGLSYGGRMTTLTAALEPRIRVAVISGALNCFQERIGGQYGCGAQVIPGLLQWGDIPEIASLIAPRTCLFEVGLQDNLLPAKWVQTSLERIGRAYTALDAKEQLQVDRFEGGHRWNGAAAYPLLDKVLKG